MHQRGLSQPVLLPSSKTGDCALSGDFSQSTFCQFPQRYKLCLLLPTSCHIT
uniref:S-tetrahydroprotoberberine N-methyltransferase-like isoform X2 n=1 Tax=Rhizophora mucronata TaxID=61149 RepID=A0A2P2LGS7_RHIMU